MIKEGFAAKCLGVGLSLGAVTGGFAAYDDYSRAEGHNLEVATQFLNSRDYLQTYVDGQYKRISDELKSAEQWLGPVCLQLIEGQYDQLDSLTEIRQAGDCTVPRELRDAAAPLINDMRADLELLEYYTASDGESSGFKHVADNAAEAVQDGRNTGLMEMFGNEDSEVIAIRIDENDKITEVHSKKPNRAYLIISLASLATGTIAAFAGSVYRSRHNAKKVREEQKHVIEEAERAAIDDMVQSETFDMDLIGKDEFWNRMQR